MPYDWMMGLLGGSLIGLAAAFYLLVNGRIMGASGIIGGLVDGTGRSSAGGTAGVSGRTGAGAGSRSSVDWGRNACD